MELEEIRGEHEGMIGPLYYMARRIHFVMVLCFRNKIHRLNFNIYPKLRFPLNLTGYIDTTASTSSALKPLSLFYSCIEVTVNCTVNFLLSRKGNLH